MAIPERFRATATIRHPPHELMRTSEVPRRDKRTHFIAIDLRRVEDIDKLDILGSPDA